MISSVRSRAASDDAAEVIAQNVYADNGYRIISPGKTDSHHLPYMMLAYPFEQIAPLGLGRLYGDTCTPAQ